MSQSNAAGIRAFTSGGAIAQYARVKMSGANVVVAGATEKGIGVAITSASGAGVSVSVKLWACDGTRKVIVSAAVAAGAALYGTASGKHDSNANGSIFLYALEAGSGDGSIIEAAVA